ncbi:MAG: hypothetical protein ACE5FY_01910 [Nitrospiria bacterium]
MTSEELRTKFNDWNTLIDGRSQEPGKSADYEKIILGYLHDGKSELLRRVGEWKECPVSYRRRLCERLQNIDLTKKEACLKLDDLKREAGMLEFNLLLNPSWVHGLLNIIDDILDNTEPESRKHLSSEFGSLKEKIGHLKNTCSQYQMLK